MTLPLDEIAALSLMKGVHLDEIAPLLAPCSLRELAKEEILLSPHSTRGEVFLVLAGQLRIHLQTPDDEPVSIIAEGEGVGELSLLVSAPRSAFVIADSDCRLLHIPEAIFWELLETSHALTLNYLRMLSLRLRQNNSVVTESRELQLMYKRRALTDGMTTLNNRRWFDDIYKRLFARCARQSIPLSVLMLDIDHFKRFNDTYGHHSGDFALFIVAQIFKSCFRPTDLIARYGGEEFVVMMPHTDKQEAFLAAERVRQAVEGTHLEMPDGQILNSVTVSLGIAQLSAGVDAAALLRQADEALYRAKSNGRNRTEIYDKEVEDYDKEVEDYDKEVEGK